MTIDITIPKRDSNKTLVTLLPSLTKDEIEKRNPEWYSPDAMHFADSLLIDDENSFRKICDPDMEYITMESTDAAEKYIRMFHTANDTYERETAGAVCTLLLSEVFYMNGKIHDELKQVRDS